MLFNYKSRIIKDFNLLSIEYKPKKIIGRKKEISDLAFNLSYFFREHYNLPKLFIYGTTGTGKTTIVNYVLDELKKECKKQKRQLKIIRLKGSDCRSKYEILKRMLLSLNDGAKVPRNSSEVRDKLLETIKNKGLNLLIFVDEVHNIIETEINGVLYFISRLGEDLNYFEESHKKLDNTKQGKIGYILVSNEMTLLNSNKIQDNTKSSITKERITFSRYSPEEISEILKERINDGALYEGTLPESVINLISSLSVKEGEDSRYAILLLSKAAKVAEEKGLNIIEKELIMGVNKELRKNLLKEMMSEYPSLYLKVLKIIYNLSKTKLDINSKNIYEIYEKGELNQDMKVVLSRISQILTDLEKDRVIYLISKRKNRCFSIKENEQEIFDVLTEKGVYYG